MALDLNVTREVLEQTHRRSWRLIWEDEIQTRLPTAGQPAGGEGTEDPNGTEKAPDGEGPKKPDDEGPEAPDKAAAPTRRPKKTKGANKTADKEQENEWSAHNRAWERDLDVTLNNLKRLFAFRKRCNAEQWQRLVRDVDPSLGARVRHVSEEGLEVADALDDPLKQEADALTETGRVKTTPARRASRPVQPSAGAAV
jgi:hypothetical protein